MVCRAGDWRLLLVAGDEARLANGVEWIGLTAERAVPTGQCIKQQKHPQQLPQAFSRRLIDKLQRAHEQTDATGEQADQQ